MTVLDTTPAVHHDGRHERSGSGPVAPEDASWYWVLSRGALFTAVVFAALFVIMGGFIGFDESAPHEYVELLQAQRAPGAYRVFSMFDIFVWLGIGATLITFAAVLRRTTPIRAAFIAACGIGQLAGALGGSLRLYVVSDLAARFAGAAPDQQAALISVYRTVDQVVTAHFNLGATLYGIGFVLIAWAGVTLVGFPRWLAIWFGLSGSVVLVLNFLGAATTAEPQVWGLIGLVVFVLGLHAGIAAAFWRRGRTTPASVLENGRP